MFVIGVSSGLWALAASNKQTTQKVAKPAESIVLGNPVIGTVTKDGKLQATLVAGIVLTLRNDGVIGWKLSPEAKKQFEEEEKKGLKLPPPSYESGKR